MLSNFVALGMCTMRMLEHNSTSNNSSVLGNSSGGCHGGGGAGSLLSSPMQTNLSLGITHGSVVNSNGVTDRLDASSDSAVSSMGSERVPSLSDGEWGDNGSDSAQEYHPSKYGGPYDYSYNSRLGDSSRQQPPYAQKKHHMFGKRYFQEQNTVTPISQSAVQQQQQQLQQQQQQQEQLSGSIKYEYDHYGMPQTPIAPHSMEGAVGPLIREHHLSSPSEMKYSCSLDFARQNNRMHDIINHNHSYTLPQGSGATPRPQARDKKVRKPEDEHLSRDEKKAREHKVGFDIPMSVHEIINLPMDEFNERLSKYDLTEVQLSLIRDIRRRGKNKVAAQNCRKRKLDQILTLADEVKVVRINKEILIADKHSADADKKSIMDKFGVLYRQVFQYLRDADGNLYSQSRYNLQLSADGNVYVLPRDNNKPDNSSSPNHSHNNHNQGPSSSNHYNHKE